MPKAMESNVFGYICFSKPCYKGAVYFGVIKALKYLIGGLFALTQ